MLEVRTKWMILNETSVKLQITGSYFQIEEWQTFAHIFFCFLLP